jgi:hypothetical protein
MPEATTEVHLTCVNCGHGRQHHPRNAHCGFNIRITRGEVRCPCVHFDLDPDVMPDVTARTREGDDRWWEVPEPLTMSAAAAVGHIERGDFDPYLEIILTAGHDRKKALRNIPGFPRRDRRRPA